MSTATDNTMMLMTINDATNKRSVSPMTPSPSRELRGIKLFRAISRKLTRRSNDEFSFTGDADSRSSSTDSCSSTSAGRCSRMKKIEVNTSGDSGFRSISPHQFSSSSSDISNESHFTKHRHHSTSTESVLRVFQNLTINTTRSHSCNNTKENKRRNSGKKSPPKRILRSPVTYTYVKGLSGLPTQRIPKQQCRVYLNSSCGCNVQYMAGLNR